LKPVEFLPTWLSESLFWIFYNQTLIAGLLALTIGALTIQQIRKQMEVERESRADARARRLRALKAGLPIALSQLHEYADEMLTALSVYFSPYGELLRLSEDWLVQKISDELETPNLPKYPREAFEAIQNAIEYAEPNDAETMHEIISYGQINASRFRSIMASLTGQDKNRVLTETNAHYAVRDALGLKMHIERVFPYSRNSSENILDFPSADEACSKLHPKLNNERVCKFVAEHWPPNFPRKDKA